jgi:uncharacterized RDD family membrane protein YckC
MLVRRSIAWLVDVGLLFPIVAVSLRRTKQEKQGTAQAAVGTMGFLLLFPIAASAFDGRTAGRAVCGIRLRSDKGYRLSLSRILVRECAVPIAGVVCGMTGKPTSTTTIAIASADALLALLTPSHRGFGDRLAHTRVALS